MLSTIPAWMRWLHRGGVVAWVMLAVTLGVSALAYVTVQREIEHAAEQRFLRAVDDTREELAARLRAQEGLLLGARGLFDAVGAQAAETVDASRAELVSRRAFHEFVSGLELERTYPGLKSLGYAAFVAQGARADLEARARREVPSYAITPSGDGPATPILFIEPRTERTSRVLGYDMASDDVRRRAMERARDSGRVAMSGRVRLKGDRESGGSASGFILFAPVYRFGQPHSSVAERQRALAGYVFTPFHADEFARGALAAPSEMELRIYDDASYDRELLHDGAQRPLDPAFIAIRDIDVPGGKWRLAFASRPRAEALVGRMRAWLVLGVGALISGLAFVVVWTGASMRSRAMVLAGSMTEAFRQSVARLRAILDNVVDGVITVDAAGVIDSANPAAEQIFGHGTGELVGLNLSGLVSDIAKTDVSGAIHDARAASVRKEMVGRRADGTTFPMELALSPLRGDGRGKLTGIVRDITEQKRVNRMKSEFVSTVSHELRTPLTSIRGSLGILQGGAVGPMPDKARTMLDIAIRNCDRLIRLINDILNVEKIESGKLELHARLTELRPLIDQAIEANAGFGEQFGVRFVVPTAVPNVAVRVDGDAFAQVMANLLSNAAKFSPPGAAVQIVVSARASRARIDVIDRGPGIPAEFESRIFQKFSQADGSDTKQKGGTGLGLSICKALVERMGGTIGFDTQVGVGTTFRVELPSGPLPSREGDPRPRGMSSVAPPPA